MSSIAEKNKSQKSAISPTREQNYPEWYQQVIKAADLAEVSPVRGCMIIKDWGYALWENMQRILDQKIKDTGHKNYYFPLFIPVSFLEKEAAHIDGFAKECAVVTHHRLVKGEDGHLTPASPLEEPYIVRPTSETIIGDAFSRWVQSYRDLPLLVNQWANIVRWEMRTRLFLRTTEFLWQEGHTAHATAKEAQQETMKMLEVYRWFAEEYLAIPVILGEKTPCERFPGAVNTFCLEAMMQDKKALQAGTSHFLGQNFSKAFDIQFSDEQGNREFAWTTSWGVSTRLIGGLIMTHSDDDGLVLPPRIAGLHVIILPILHKPEQKEQILKYCQALKEQICKLNFDRQAIRVDIDAREIGGGEKGWSWVKKGVPIRIEVGTKELENDALFVGRRDQSYKEKKSQPRQDFLNTLEHTLTEIQNNLLTRARNFQKQFTVEINSKEEFYKFFERTSGFALAHWNGDPAIEAKVKTDLSVTIRCIPFEKSSPGKCIFTGEPSPQRVIFAKAY